MRAVRFHPSAREELIAAAGWYRERSQTAGAQFMSEIQHAVDRIAESPERYPSTPLPGVRRLVLLTFPFDLIFRLLDDHIEVIAIAHHSRRPSYWRTR